MSFYLIATIGIIFIILLLMVLFFTPTQEKSKKKERPVEQQKKEQDWQATALKLERHILGLREEISVSEKKQKTMEKQIAALTAENKKLTDKINLEEGWHAKEQAEIDKRAKEISQLKEDIRRSETSLETEHAQRLRFERESKEIKQSFDSADDQRKKLDLEVLGLKAKLKVTQDELAILKRENTELKRQKEDTTFVAKSDFDDLDRRFKAKEKEFDRVVREYEKFRSDIKNEIK
jgi:chromosome segregation ATPase